MALAGKLFQVSVCIPLHNEKKSYSSVILLLVTILIKFP